MGPLHLAVKMGAQSKDLEGKVPRRGAHLEVEEMEDFSRHPRVASLNKHWLHYFVPQLYEMSQTRNQIQRPKQMRHLVYHQSKMETTQGLG